MKYLITGGLGFIGSNLAFSLLEQDFDVINLSKANYASSEKTLKELNKYPKHKFYSGDITNRLLIHSILKKEEPDMMIHLAAESHVDRSFVNPIGFFKNNTEGTLTILETLRQLSFPPFLVFMSTDKVFGETQSIPTENSILAPTTPYAASKAAAEMFIRAYQKSYGIKSSIVRSVNIYGPRQNSEKLIPKIITNCLSNTPFTLFNSDTEIDWLFVADACNAIQTIATRENSGEVYHLSSGEKLSVKKVSELIITTMDAQRLFKGYVGKRQQDDKQYILNSIVTTLKLGWKATVPFGTGIRTTIQWYGENRKWWMK